MNKTDVNVFEDGTKKVLKCEHEFARHVGVKVFNKQGMAWVQLSLVIDGEDLPEMWICTKCGEPGMEVPA